MELYQARAELTKAMAHPIRLAIIDILDQKGPQCVADLTALLPVGQPTVSKHLSILKAAGILHYRKEGLKAVYFIRTPCIADLFKCLDNALAEDLRQKQNVWGKDLEGLK